MYPSVQSDTAYKIIDKEGDRRYELANHLGNVLAVISDRKLGVANGNAPNYISFEAITISATDYFPFGMSMPGRSFTAANTEGYRYSFNGKEDDTEWAKQDYGFRIYDKRIGKFLSVDPLPLTAKYPELTPYQFSSNRPIDGIDLDGLEWTNANGKLLAPAELKKVKVYVMYDGKGEFSGQALGEAYRAVAEYKNLEAVAIARTTDTKDFSIRWGEIDGQPDRVVLNFHGKNQSLNTNGATNSQFTATENGKTNKAGSDATNVSSLPTPKADISKCELQLNTCHSMDTEPKAHGEGDHAQGDLKGSGKTLGQDFRDSFDFKSVRGTKGAVNYNLAPNTPYPEDKTWETLKRPVDSPPTKTKPTPTNRG